MKVARLSVPILLVMLGCESTTTDQGTIPELAPALDEPVAISVAIGGVT